MDHLGENVRRLRAKLNMSQSELMKRSGVTSVKQIETGTIQSPQFPHLASLASSLGVTVADLFADPEAAEERELKPARRRKAAGSR
jgi:transcriptional regulator with XRE-family HTH domain